MKVKIYLVTSIILVASILLPPTNGGETSDNLNNESNLAAYWPFDETSGTIAYDMVGSNDGTNKEIKINQPGKVGTSYLFPGPYTFVKVLDNDALDFNSDEDFSVFTWINTTQKNYGRIVEKRSTTSDNTGYGMAVWNDGTVYAFLDFGATGSGVKGTLDIADGKWHNVGMRRKGSTLDIYIDGICDGVTKNAYGDLRNSGALYIGNDRNWYYGFLGYIDDVKIYNAVEVGVITTSPSNGSYISDFSSEIKVIFNCSMDALQIPKLNQTGGDIVNYYFDKWDSTYVQNDTAVWSHNSWSEKDAITIEISDSYDEYGNNQPSPFSWTFKTTDSTSPEVIMTIPASNSDPSPYSAVTIVWNEMMDTNVTPQLDQNNGFNPGNWSFQGWSNTILSNDTATWKHNDWFDDQEISLSVDGARDHTGHLMGTPYCWFFNISEKFPPGIHITSPKHHEAGIVANHEVIIIWNDTMDTNMIPVLNQTYGHDPGGWSFQGWTTTNIANDTSTWVHNPWKAFDSISLGVSGAKNFKNISQIGTYSWNFRTIGIERSPIRINSNADFNVEHGITQGNGTVNSPWILENWIINGSNFGFCIYIGNTTDYFEIRNCHLFEASGGTAYYYWNSGLSLFNSANGFIHHNQISYNLNYGIHLQNSTQICVVANNNITHNNIGAYLSNRCESNILQNNAISSNLDRGIYLYTNCANNSIINNTVISNKYGLLVRDYCHNTVIDNNNFTLNQWADISVYYSNYSQITNNRVTSYNNDAGILFISSHYSYVYANIVTYGKEGIFLISSYYNTIEKNAISNFWDSGIESCSYNIIRNNIIQYCGNGISWGSYSIIENNIISHNSGYGIWIQDGFNTSISNNTILDNSAHGLYISYSDGFMVSNNTVSSNGIYGVFLWYSTNALLAGNNLYNNGIFIEGRMVKYWNTHTIDITNNVNGKPVYYWKNKSGGTIPQGAGQIILALCDNIVIESQSIQDTTVGIQMGYSTYNMIVNNSVSNSRYGIALFNSDCNNIINNLVYTNQYGIYLWDESTGNYIIDNEIMYSSQYGVYFWNSDWNTVYHNDFIWNVNHAYIMISDSLQWDNGYPSGGNYWSDYIGIDEFNGINQDIPGSDGIGDSPHFIIEGNQDYYPQMQQIREVPTFSINLTMGWNLISIPLDLFSNSVSDILASISGKWSVVKYYDTLDVVDPWKSYRPGGAANDLAEIDNKKGFWICIDEPNVTLTIIGILPSSKFIPLYAGWNLVGYPSLSTNMTVANALWGTGADRVEVFNSVSPYIKEAGPEYIMKPGEGYWVHVAADSVWTVDW